MKSRIKMILSAGLLAPMFVVTPVLAVEATPSPATPTQTEQTTTTTAKTTDKKKEELNARLQQRKDALKVKLTAVQEKRIQTRCKNAQGLVSSLLGKVNGTETSRTKVYANLVDRLTKLQSNLDQKGANTAELKAEITELQTKIATFNTNLAAYKQSVSDLAGMDCVADATGFKTFLEDARSGLKKVHDDGAAIKTYVNDTIKTTLKNIRVDLAKETKPATGTTETN